MKKEQKYLLAGGAALLVLFVLWRRKQAAQAQVAQSPGFVSSLPTLDNPPAFTTTGTGPAPTATSSPPPAFSTSATILPITGAIPTVTAPSAQNLMIGANRPVHIFPAATSGAAPL